MDKKKNQGHDAVERARRKAEKNQPDTVNPPIEAPAPKNYLLITRSFT
jgi:hypothetical protein